MQKITYQNSQGINAYFGYENEEYILNDISGLTVADITPVTIQGYRQHGFSYRYTQYGMRIITLSFYVYKSDMQSFYESRRALSALFNPLLQGTIIYENGYIKKAISVVVTMPLAMIETYGNLQLMSVDLTAYDPFFTDIAETEVSLRDFVGGTHLPSRFPIRFGWRGDRVTIYNTGDTEAPITAEFSGQAVNPVLRNDTTGEFIEVETTLSEGERLVITTGYGNKLVRIYDTQGGSSLAYNEISEGSTFFSLGLGENTLSFSADTGAPTVTVKYKLYYGGV